MSALLALPLEPWIRVRTPVTIVMSSSFSLLDISTDIWAITTYFSEGYNGTAIGIICMIILSQCGQCLIVYARNQHLGRRAVLREASIVFSFFKPVVDTVRLARGWQVDGQPFDTLAERQMGKITEIVCESVPSSVISLVGVLPLLHKWQLHPESSFPIAPCVSILISWLTTAHKTAGMSIEMDMEPSKRALFPGVYGYVPDGVVSKLVVRACIFFVAFGTVVSKTIAVALLGLTSRAALGSLLIADMVLYLSYKALRSDLWCWAPGTGVGVAVPFRCMHSQRALRYARRHTLFFR